MPLLLFGAVGGGVAGTGGCASMGEPAPWPGGGTFGGSVSSSTVACGSAVSCEGALADEDESELWELEFWEEDLWERDFLAGDLLGLRPKLDGVGITAEAYYLLDVLRNASGGVRQETEFLGNVDLLLTADMERLLGWTGGTFFLYGIANHGGSISEAAGDLQAISNIEGPESAKIYEAWYEQSFLEGRLSLLGGLYDVNSEFDVMPTASLFIHSAHGMGSEFGNSGLNGPSTFPVTSLAARIHVESSDRTYFRAVVADGVPGDPDDPSGTQIILDGDDGLLLAAEVGVYNLPAEELRGRARRQNEALPLPEEDYGYFGKYAVGAWRYTTEFDDFYRTDASGNPRKNDGTYGIYALADQGIYYEEDDPFQGLSAFARVGIADDRANIFDGYVGGGLVYQGLFPGRDGDRLGFGMAAAHLGDDFRTGAARGGEDFDSWEVDFELTYRVWLTPWVFVQPDMQYVLNPGGDPSLDNAFVFGVRFVAKL